MVVPGPEGSWITRALREAELEVEPTEVERESSDVVVLATTVEDFEERARDLGQRTRVVAVGWDPLPPELHRQLGEFFSNRVAPHIRGPV